MNKELPSQEACVKDVDGGQIQQPLTFLENAKNALDAAPSLEQIIDIRHRVDLTEKYAQNHQLGLDVRNHALEIKLRAERAAGRILSSLRLRGGDRRSTEQRSHLRIADFGITQNQSTRWQQLATVPESTFYAYLLHAKATRSELSAAGLLRAAKSNTSAEEFCDHSCDPDTTYDYEQSCTTPTCTHMPSDRVASLAKVSYQLSVMQDIVIGILATEQGWPPTGEEFSLLRRLLSELTSMLADASSEEKSRSGHRLRPVRRAVLRKNEPRRLSSMIPHATCDPNVAADRRNTKSRTKIKNGSPVRNQTISAIV